MKVELYDSSAELWLYVGLIPHDVNKLDTGETIEAQVHMPRPEGIRQRFPEIEPNPEQKLRLSVEDNLGDFMEVDCGTGRRCAVDDFEVRVSRGYFEKLKAMEPAHFPYLDHENSIGTRWGGDGKIEIYNLKGGP